MTVTSATAGFHVMAKPAGPRCNLDCTYCFYLEKEKLYPEERTFEMSDAVLDAFVRQYIEGQDAPVVSFAWQGGEPTLRGLAFFERVVALQAQYGGGRRIENAMQTNGILLDDRWCAFLARNQFLVGLSVDGPAPLHDRYRVDRGGGPTFDRVMRALQLLSRHGVAFNTLTTVHRGNSDHPLEVYRFLKSIGSQYLQFIPIVERVSTAPTTGLTLVAPGAAAAGVSRWSVEPAAYGEFLCRIFDEWVRRDVGSTFVQLFDVALESWCGLEPSLCLFAEKCGRALAIEHNGDLYSCDHFVYPEHRLGNLLNESLGDMVAAPRQVAFGEAKRDRLPEECRACDVRFACHGECPKHRFVRSRDGSHDLNYLCGSYKRFFQHIHSYMTFMAGALAEGRPPASVMAWARSNDAAAALRNAGRNDPCPCGSGKKVKRCCGHASAGSATSPAGESATAQTAGRRT